MGNFDNYKMAAYNYRMFIQRDISQRLADSKMPVQFVIGPRQCGKSTLLLSLSENTFNEVTFDDLQLRNLANQDPALFLEQFPPPVLLDEVQYVPQLFSEIKAHIDRLKRQRLQTNEKIPTLYRMTGSNQLLLDKNVKESLAGRASYFNLNTLSVHEILQALPDTSIQNILFKGGWPELYIDQDLSVVQYLNDYILSYVEKDVVLSAGVQKLESFNLVLGLLAARTGMLLDYNDIANHSGVRAVTITEWIGLLQRTSLVYCLKPYANNLNKRLTKTPKFYFLDTGLAVRLQGWQDLMPMMNSPSAGPLFETLVFAEIVKFIQNYGKDWQLYFWRTKSGEEIDFMIVTEAGKVIALDAKMSIKCTQAIAIPKTFAASFPATKEIIIVTYGGEKRQLSDVCLALPLADLHDFLRNFV